MFLWAFEINSTRIRKRFKNIPNLFFKLDISPEQTGILPSTGKPINSITLSITRKRKVKSICDSNARNSAEWSFESTKPKKLYYRLL